MAKLEKRQQTVELRQSGYSIRAIAHELNLSKSTVSLWCRDIILSPEQKERLHEQQVVGGYSGRLKGARAQYLHRLSTIEVAKQAGLDRFRTINKNDLFLVGLGIYWGEGEKSDKRMSFCNSDPELIKFMIHWLTDVFDIQLEDLRFQVGINEAYRSDIERIERFWHTITGATSEQFTKPSYKKVINKKIYTNAQSHYGTLRVSVTNPSLLQRKILGMIEGLKQASITHKAV